MVSELHALDVVGRGTFALAAIHHLVGRHAQEFGLWVDEFSDQPRAGDPIYFHLLARHPLHGALSSRSSALQSLPRALQPRERLPDAVQMGMFTATHPLIFCTLQRALICLPSFED